MVAPAGNSPIISPLGQNWQQVDLGPLNVQISPSGEMTSASSSFDSGDSYGEPKKSGGLLKWVIGIPAAAAAIYGLARAGKGMKFFAEATEGWKKSIKSGSEWVVNKTHGAGDWIKKNIFRMKDEAADTPKKK